MNDPLPASHRGTGPSRPPGSLSQIAVAAVALGLGLLPWWLAPDAPLALRIGTTIAGLFAVALSFWQLQRRMRRLNALHWGLRALAQGRSETRLTDTGRDALGDLAAQANALAARLRELTVGLEDRIDRGTRRLRDERDALLAQNQQLRDLASGAQDEARAQSELLSSLSHELRTPLTGILGYADLLRQSGLNTEQAQQLDTLEKSGRALLSMINDLLDWSRIGAGRLRLNEETFELTETVEDTCALLAALAYDKNLELVPIIYHDVPREVRGDAQRLRQILTNLLSNAIKFTDRGEVVVRVMREREDAGRAWLRFSVSDTGIGIAPEQQARLFQPYRQLGKPHAQASGSGLGLSITRKLCELIGGEISIESTPGVGSTFSVLLPFKLIAEAESTPVQDARLVGRTVWLFEAHATSRLALIHWLEFWGLQPRRFARADELAETLDSTPQSALPDLVILGLSPGDRGLPPFRAILKTCAERGPPLLVLVASAALPVHEDLRNAGAAACHAKSIGHRRLLEQILRLVADGSGDDALPLAGQRILIADNDNANRRYLAALCRELGLDPIEASGGPTAVELWLRERPRYVMLDAHMPELDGAACATEIRRREGQSPGCRIVGISAHLEPEERHAFRAAGADAILIKPFDNRALLRALQPDGQREVANARRLTADPELLALLRDELPQQFRDLQSAFEARDLKAARDAAHTLRGTAAFYHLASLRQTSAALEDWLQRNTEMKESAHSRRELEHVRQAVDDTLSAIRPP